MQPAPSPQDWEEPARTAPLPQARDALAPGLLDVGAVFAFLWRHLFLLMLLPVIGAALAVAANVALPARYTAAALLQIETRNTRVTPFEDVVAGIGSDSAAIASVIEVANSDAALQAIVEGQGLMSDPELAAPSLLGGAKTEADVMAALSKALRVQRRGLTYIIEISVTLRDAKRAAALANAVADYIARMQAESRATPAADAAASIATKLVRLGDIAKTSEDAVVTFRKLHGLAEKQPDGTIGERRLNYLAQQIAQTRDKLEAARSRYDEVRRAKPLDLDTPSLNGSTLLSTLRTQYAAERRQAAELAQIYGPLHPNVKLSRERVVTLSGQVKAEMERLTANARSEVDALQQQITAMEAELGKQNKDEIATSDERAQLQRLESQAALDRDVYDQFSKKQKVTEEQKDLNQPDAIIASKAMVPARSNKASPLLVAPVGALLGFFVALVAGYGLESRRAGRGGGRRAAPLGAAAAKTPVADAPTPVVAMIDELPPGPPAPPGSNQALLDVVDARVALTPFFAHLAPLLQPKNGQLMAVTTLGATRGRTTAAVALAHLAAKGGASVLVVSDHGLGAMAATGLRDIVLGYANPRGLARYDAGSDFTLLRSGCATPEDFWALAGHRNFAAVAGMLKEFWDFVVIEAPPLQDDRAPALPTPLFGALLLVADPRVVRHGDIMDAVNRWPEPLQKASMIAYNYPPAQPNGKAGIHAWAT